MVLRVRAPLSAAPPQLEATGSWRAARAGGGARLNQLNEAVPQNEEGLLLLHIHLYLYLYRMADHVACPPASSGLFLFV